MNNIDEFNRACTTIFSVLYDSFPIPINVSPSSVNFIDKLDIRNEPRQIFSETMCFLADESYIQFDRSTDNMHQKKGVRLTAKGLARLQKIPDGIQPNAKSLIDQIKDAAVSIGGQVSNTGANEAAKEILKLVFGN